MPFRILTLAPIWYLLICIAAAVLLTWLLYRKSAFENLWLKRVMIACRFLGLFCVFALLLSPMILLKLNKEIKPQILVFFDKSASARNVFDSKQSAILDKQLDVLKEDFDLRIFDFAGEIQQQNDTLKNINETRLDGVTNYINELYIGNPVKAVVVVSDGIINKGINPLFQSFVRPIPVFTIGIGDTVQYPDAKISGLSANSTVFLDNEFVIETSVQCYGIASQQLQIGLYENGKKLSSKTWIRSANEEFTKIDFIVKASEPGLKRYTVKLDPVTSDANPLNDEKSVFVNVTDTRRRVALVVHSPHPDIAALKRVLDKNIQYQYKIYERGNLPGLMDFDMAICHGFTSEGPELNWLQRAIAGEKPIFFIAGIGSGSLLSQPEFGLGIQVGSGTINDVQAIFQSSFTEFSITDHLEKNLSKWPPLKVPYGRYTVATGFKTLFSQRVGAINSEMPLFGFTNSASQRMAWLFGEGIWKWALSDFQINGNHEAFEEFVTKTIQYLSSDDVKQPFRLYAEQPKLEAGDAAVIIGEYYDQNMQLSTKPDCDLTISGENGFSKKIVMARNGNRYRAELGTLQAGDYRFVGSLKNTGLKPVAGTFHISPQIAELSNKKADHGLLRLWSEKTKGDFTAWSPSANLPDMLKKKVTPSGTIHQEKKITELIHVKWFFVAIILFFSVEWFLRKWEGAY